MCKTYCCIVLHYTQDCHYRGNSTNRNRLLLLHTLSHSFLLIVFIVFSHQSPLSIDHHKGDHNLSRLAVSRDSEHLYRGFPFHPFHPPPPDGKGFGDRYGNELDLRHLHRESLRRPAGEPPERPGMREPLYLDNHPFAREGFRGGIPRMDRGIGDREWQRRERTPLLNGDYIHGTDSSVLVGREEYSL